MVSASTPLIRVVAAVISHNEKYLITQRRPTAVLGGLWEFPGGRVESGETDAAALRRELKERLGVDIEVHKEMARRRHAYEGYSVELTLYSAKVAEGQEPRALRVADCRWVGSAEFEKYPFPAADQATTDLLLGIKRG